MLESLGRMPANELGVRRAGITEAAGRLQVEGGDPLRVYSERRRYRAALRADVSPQSAI